MNDDPSYADASDVAADLPSVMICIQGASDNLAAVFIMKDGKKEAHEEYDVPGHKPVRFRLFQGGRVGMDVVLIFLENGVWSAGVAQLDEGHSIPKWPTSFMASGYSTAIAFAVPTMVTVELVSDADVG